MRVELLEDSNKSDVVFIQVDSLSSQGKLRIKAVDENGQPIIGGYLLDISSEGVFLHPGVSRSLGFKLTTSGRLAIEGDS